MQEKAKILTTEVVYKGHFPLKNITFSTLNRNGKWVENKYEIYGMGGASAVLLYNREQKTVLLTRQFRLPAFLHQNGDGMSVEVCAGKLSDEHPEEGMLREIEEETGYKVPAVHKVFEAYMSPAYITEIIYFFTAEYDSSMKVSEGGGVDEENEEIEVLEMPFGEAISLVNNGTIKDAKTLLLLQYAQVHKLVE